MDGYVSVNDVDVVNNDVEHCSMFQRPFKIIISNVTVESHSPKCRINNSFADTGTFSVNVEFLKRIRNPFMHTDLYLESDNGKLDMELLNSTVDLCQFYRTKRFKPVVQLILKLFEEHFTHWFKSCPVNKVKNCFFFFYLQ